MLELLKKLNEERTKIKNLEVLTEKLEDMIRILGSVNCKLKEENKTLKDRGEEKKIDGLMN